MVERSNDYFLRKILMNWNSWVIVTSLGLWKSLRIPFGIIGGFLIDTDFESLSFDWSVMRILSLLFVDSLLTKSLFGTFSFSKAKAFSTASFLNNFPRFQIRPRIVWHMPSATCIYFTRTSFNDRSIATFTDNIILCGRVTVLVGKTVTSA